MAAKGCKASGVLDDDRPIKMSIMIQSKYWKLLRDSLEAAVDQDSVSLVRAGSDESLSEQRSIVLVLDEPDSEEIEYTLLVAFTIFPHSTLAACLS